MTFEIGAVASGPIAGRARYIEDDLHTRELLASPLQLLEEGSPLDGLQPGTDTNLQELADDAFTQRKIWR